MVRRAVYAALVVVALTSACATFETESIVLDLRVLAMRASYGDPALRFGPEQVIDVDLAHPDPTAILAQLQPTTVCGLIADPGAHRALRWDMTVCLLTLEDRCDPDHAQIPLGSAMIEDPEDSTSPQVACADVVPGQQLLTMLREAVIANPVQAVGGIEYGVVLAVGDPATPDVRAYAAKHLRVAARIPATRLPNQNPRVDYVDGALRGASVGAPALRCAEDGLTGIATVVGHSDVVTLFPVEPAGVRERYDAPTLDGHTASLTETLSYQWLATDGSFSDETTGGGHDVLGNQSLLGTQWTAPRSTEPAHKTSIWMIQRDERYGVSWVETCFALFP